jgi:hypothetical protein
MMARQRMAMIATNVKGSVRAPAPRTREGPTTVSRMPAISTEVRDPVSALTR